MRKLHGHTSRFTIGLDLGQKRDHSALAAIERRETEYNQRNPVTAAFERTVEYRLHAVRRVRLGTPYPDVSAEAARWVKTYSALGTCSLVVDGTGVGAPVVDMLKAGRLACPVIPVTITGGDRAGSDGGSFRVPKMDLIGGLQTMVEKDQIRMARRGGEVEPLISELIGMTQRGRRMEGQPDDLVIAVALAWWWAQRGECGWRGGRLI